MQNLRNNRFYAILLTTLLTASIIAAATLPMVNAHDPPWDIPTYAYIVVSPDPIGIDQTAFIVMWLDKVPPTAGGIGGDRWTGFTVDITKPDGSTAKVGPLTSDATSAAWALFTVDQLGTYTFDFSFPGQTASLYHPETGIPGSNSAYIGDYYMPSQASTTLTVQAEGVKEPPTYPLPTTYWTRPIEGQNTAWASMASNYLGGSSIVNAFQPNGAGPNSAHVMWTKPLQDGGIVGDSFSIPAAAYYTGLSYEGKFGNPLIINGRLYYDAPLSDDPNDGPYTCVDLATGETLWENPDIAPSFGQLYLYESFNQHGVIDGYLWQTQGNTWRAFDARTGEPLFNMTGVPSGTTVMGPNGEFTRYVLNTNDGWLALWNSSAGPDTPLVRTPGNSTNAFQYRPIGKEADMSEAYTWNITIPNNLPSGSSIREVIPDDMVLLSTSTSTGGFFGFGSQEYTMTAISLKPFSKGYILWQKTYQPPEGNMTRSFGPVDPVNRVFTVVDKEIMQWSGYDLDSGAYLWGPAGDFRDFQYYGRVSNPPAPGFVAYDHLYVAGYGGELLAFNIRTGAIDWRYNNTYSGEQTPWGLYPLFISTIADGKIYCYSSEHSPNVPLYKGSRVRCIDAHTGEEKWTLMSWYAIGSFGQQGAPIADGNLIYLNVYDMQIYCIGKGPSETTVTASPKVTTKGSSVMIEGTINDVSPGAKKLIAEGKFQNVPAMSDESNGPWMEHIYMQKPVPDNATGVPVTITAINENGDGEVIATVTSDLSGMFYYKWTPNQEGSYKIVASFDGSDSYYASYAQTSVGVDAAPAASPVIPTSTPTQPSTTTPPSVTTPPTQSPSPSEPVPPETQTSNDVYIIGAVAAVIVIVAAAAAILLRRRK